MTIVERAAWILERNSSEGHTLAGLAAACGVSRSHLAQAFGVATGVGVMGYLRGRRLSRAAQALADGAPDILTVALDAGYGSHEAFTRAFKDQFGSTPEAVRDQQSVHGLAMVAPLDLRASSPAGLEPPRFDTVPAITAVGASEPCTFTTTMRIPGQWQRFMAAPVHAIGNAVPSAIPIGLTFPANDDGAFDYACAVEVTSLDHVPDGLTRFDLPAREYAIFEHRGHVSRIFETYAAIWNTALPATGRTSADAPTIERHHETFDPRSGEGGVALWVPLEARV